MKSKSEGAKTASSGKIASEKSPEKVKLNRIQRQIQSDLSPKFTEMKTAERTSRFGRPQKETTKDAGVIPTEVAKFVSKHSPKRLKPKEIEKNVSDVKVEPTEKVQQSQNIPYEDKENEFVTETLKQQKQVESDTKSALEPMDIEEDKCETIDKVAEESEKDPVQCSEVEQLKSELIFEDYKESPSSIFEDFTKDENQNDSKNVALEDEKVKQDFSDTDSALGGSATSCNNEVKGITNRAYFAGQILWGSFNGTSWFPCMAYPFDDEGNVVADNGKIHVKYFNWNGAVAWLKLNCVFEYKGDLDHFWEQIETRNIKKNKVKPFGKTCYKAIEEANFFRNYPVSERMKIFNEVLEHQQQQKSGLRKFLEPKNDIRKSIDSALGAGESPATAPSSPVNETAVKIDPILSYLKTMERYDAIQALTENKEKKQPVKVKKMMESEPCDSSKDEENQNRRKSTRAVKKRKLEDYEEIIESKKVATTPCTPSTSTPTPSTSTRDSSQEPKAKRPKIMKEETLEERFLVNVQDLRAMFRNLNKKRVCSACLTTTKEPTYRCSGMNDTKCGGWFHESCAGSSEQKFEEIRHLTGDSEEVFQTQTKITVVKCVKCLNLVKNCFVCDMPVNEEEEYHHCPNSDCRLAFHKPCLKNWPQASKKNNFCPQHTCHTCFSKELHNGGSLVKCMKCPAAYHLQLCCLPAGSKILSQTQIVCPRHPTEKEQKEEALRAAKDKHVRLNIDFCAVCMQNGNLVCCDSCPSAFHTECIKFDENEETFMCQECMDGRLPLYNTIVWARVGSYRWWPGLIMPSHIVPELVLKNQKNQREFCIRFFGSYDYFWFTCERVFNYDGANFSVKIGNSRLDSAFNAALSEAHKMSNILSKHDEHLSSSKPKPYSKILANRPIPPVKLKKPNDTTISKCTCSPDDQNPCGFDSDCINMQLHFECQKENCPAGVKCQNQKLRNREYAEIKIEKTKNRGFGAICVKDVPENTFIIEYVGDLIDSAELNRRMARKLERNEKDFYFLTVEADLYVDAEPSGNLARFINHSCDPNCDTKKIVVDGNTRIGIFSNKPITSGTELTFDYQMEFVGKEKTACFCESSNCIGLIGEKRKEPEKKKQARKVVLKKKQKKKTQRRVTSLEASKDPFVSMMEKIVEKQEDKKKVVEVVKAKEEPMEVVEIEEKPKIITEKVADTTEAGMDLKQDGSSISQGSEPMEITEESHKAEKAKALVTSPTEIKTEDDKPIENEN